MVTVQQAVASAIDHITRFGDLAAAQGLRLEEFELDEQKGVWLITLSFVDRDTVSFPQARIYRTFEVSAENGNVRSMKLRNPLLPRS